MTYQSWRQDSVTGGAEIKFAGARKVYLSEFERSTGAREIYPSLDQMNKVKTKNLEGFSGPRWVISEKKRSSLKFRGIFRPKSEIQIVFPAEDR